MDLVFHENRGKLQEIIEKHTGERGSLILDRNHNSVERNENGEVVYRKGAVKLNEGEKQVMPSSKGEDALIVIGNSRRALVDNSLSHGTGRKMSRSEAKEKMLFLDDNSTDRVYVPSFLGVKSGAIATVRALRGILGLDRGLMAVSS